MELPSSTSVVVFAIFAVFQMVMYAEVNGVENEPSDLSPGLGASAGVSGRKNGLGIDEHGNLYLKIGDYIVGLGGATGVGLNGDGPNVNPHGHIFAGRDGGPMVDPTGDVKVNSQGVSSKVNVDGSGGPGGST